jgi:8-oxo-dGTP pyrophosphatase MutT (NUDIX family)
MREVGIGFLAVDNSKSTIYMHAVKDTPMAQEETKNPWKTLSGEEKYQNKWITVTEYRVINPSGGKGIYGKVQFKNKAVGIIPLDSDLNTWLVGQYRYTLNEWSWEIPEGGSPLEFSPLECAKRELKEETGLTAKRWTRLMRLHTSNSVTDEEGFIFIAEDLEEGERELEETEAGLKVWKLPFREALQMVLEGKITDSLSVMGILMMARKLKL